MQESTRQQVMQLPNLPNKFIDLLEETGFRTGSSVYSNATPNDIDWCVCVPPHVFDGYVVSAKGAPLDPDPDYNHGGLTVVYGHRYDTIHNIMCFADISDMNAWWITTRIMQHLKRQRIPYGWNEQGTADLNDLFDSKWKRVRVFRAFRDVFTPVEPLQQRLSMAEAIDRHKCRRCGQEAINFIDTHARNLWKMDGICDRCREEQI